MSHKLTAGDPNRDHLKATVTAGSTDLTPVWHLAAPKYTQYPGYSTLSLAASLWASMQNPLRHSEAMAAASWARTLH